MLLFVVKFHIIINVTMKKLISLIDRVELSYFILTLLIPTKLRILIKIERE